MRAHQPNPRVDRDATAPWVPQLVALLTELHRNRESRFAFAGQFATKRSLGRYPDAAA